MKNDQPEIKKKTGRKECSGKAAAGGGTGDRYEGKFNEFLQRCPAVVCNWYG